MKKKVKTIEQLGSEFKLIDLITQKPKSPQIIKGIGDDGAIVHFKQGEYVLATDMLVEDQHFSLKTFTPKEVGIKVIQTNLSDLAAMGAWPLYALVSLAISKHTAVQWVKGLYEGFRVTCKQYAFDILGGDTTLSDKIHISMTLIGKKLTQKNFLRSKAKPHDRIKVTGTLGNAKCGLLLLSENIKGFTSLKAAQKKPKARLDILNQVLPYANALMDISDGLLGDLFHLCKQSNKGAKIFLNQLPIKPLLLKAAKKLKQNPLPTPTDMALYGGEDYELLYTTSSEHASKSFGYEIGEILHDTKKIILVLPDGAFKVLGPKDLRGFDHFKK